MTFFFMIGGAAATLMRLELVTPQGDLVQSETYNKLFTMHGVMMVWFFLIPSIPSVLGNFLVPLMIGAPRSGVSAAQFAELVYLYHRRRASRSGRSSAAAWTPAGRSTRPTAACISNTHVMATAVGVFIAGFSSILTGLEFHRDDPQDALPGADLVSPAAVHLGDLCDQPDPGAGHAGAGDHAGAGGDGAAVRASAFSIRRWGAIRCCFSTCSGSTRTRRSTS